MRFTIITMSIALVLAVAVCSVSLYAVDKAVYEMQDICMQAIDYVVAGDDKMGAEQMTLLATTWERYRPWLEIIISHGDMHTVTQLYTEASINLECAYYDDFHKSMALLDESLKHISNQERLTISNVL